MSSSRLLRRESFPSLSHGKMRLKIAVLRGFGITEGSCLSMGSPKGTLLAGYCFVILRSTGFENLRTMHGSIGLQFVDVLHKFTAICAPAPGAISYPLIGKDRDCLTIIFLGSVGNPRSNNQISSCRFHNPAKLKCALDYWLVSVRYPQTTSVRIWASWHARIPFIVSTPVQIDAAYEH